MSITSVVFKQVARDNTQSLSLPNAANEQKAQAAILRLWQAVGKAIKH
jgi:hypothetical protein